MSMPQALEFVGGSRDGVRGDPGPGETYPDTLFLVTMDDGEAYARTGEEIVDEDGRLRAVFAFDPDGALTERAKRAYCHA